MESFRCAHSIELAGRYGVPVPMLPGELPAELKTRLGDFGSIENHFWRQERFSLVSAANPTIHDVCWSHNMKITSQAN
jgi:hypothetical protein